MFTVFAQESATVTGYVIDAEKNEQLAFVNVLIQGMSKGTTTNKQGFFTIQSVPAGDYLIEASLIGYQKQVRKVALQASETIQINFGLVPTIFEMDEIIVEAQRKGSSASLMSVQSIQSKEIKRLVPSTTAEILSAVPGISISRSGSWGSKPYFQGMTDSRILVFVDGVKVNQACPMGMDACTATIEPDLIETVEVEKGPGSAQYGSGNLGGVINISTINSKYSTGEKFKTDFRLMSKYESVSNSRTGTASFQGGNRTFDFIAAISGGKHDNYQTRKGLIENSGYQSTNVHFKARYKPAYKHKVQFTTQVYRAQDIGWAASNTIIPDEKRDTYALNYFVIDISPYLQMIKTNVSFQRMFHTMVNYLADKPQFVGDSKSNTYNLDLETYWKTGDKNRLTTGIFYSLWEMTANRRPAGTNSGTDDIDILPQASTAELGYFIEDEYVISDRLKTQAGIRINYIASKAERDSISAIFGNSLNADESVFSGSAAIRYKMAEDISATFSVSRGFKSATPVERYISTPMMDGYYRIGNPNLSAETNWSKRLTLQGMHDRYSWSFEIYHNSLSNLISAEVDTGIESPYQGLKGVKRFRNITEAYVFGGSAQIGIALISSLFMSTNLSYDWGRDEKTSDPLPLIAPLQSTTKLTYDNVEKGYWLEFAAKLVATQNRYVERYGEKRTPGYAVFDMRSGWQISESVEITAGVKNIFNKYYRNHLNQAFLPEPGRSMYVTANISLPVNIFKNSKPHFKNTRQVRMSIEGMACQFCVKTVRERLYALPGVVSTEVSLEEKSAHVIIRHNELSVSELIRAVERAGFKAEVMAVDKDETLENRRDN